MIIILLLKTANINQNRYIIIYYFPHSNLFILLINGVLLPYLFYSIFYWLFLLIGYLLLSNSLVSFNFLIIIIIIFLSISICGIVIAMIIYRTLLIKFFLCCESFFFIISVIMILWTQNINGTIIILYLLWNSTFELSLGFLLFIILLFIIFSYVVHCCVFLYLFLFIILIISNS